MTVKEILIEWLREHDYTGLYNDQECGCAIDDFIPCDGECADCQPGYKVPCDPEETDSGFNFMIMAEKPKK